MKRVMEIKGNIIGLLIVLSAVLVGCKSTQYVEVPVETVRTEYKVQKDSIYLHDSINVYTEIKGDTIYTTKFAYKIKEVFKTDTVLKVDSIPVVVTVDKVMEVNRLYNWLKILMWLGGVGVVVLLGFILNKLKIWKLLF